MKRKVKKVAFGSRVAAPIRRVVACGLSGREGNNEKFKLLIIMPDGAIAGIIELPDTNKSGSL